MVKPNPDPKKHRLPKRTGATPTGLIRTMAPYANSMSERRRKFEALQKLIKPKEVTDGGEEVTST